MNHYNYKITNIITGEYYIGVRSCKCEIKEDSYMGSSSIWTKLYIKEHRKELVKEILEEYPSRKLANDAEVLRLKQCKGGLKKESCLEKEMVCSVNIILRKQKRKCLKNLKEE